ncbi:MAG: hypothetical protein HON53_14365 [Planctomycetaceae bacterium]|jgi:hypothetical protein|nr:hypothetical protein [Planctomycetaceae bacterium]MBT6155432.1 hypothetical protein [Planctomycetaceae bacterium]MBT6485619.1 hypothetical protein [Planctomycetaceae bacterium]MBT6494993.1 hypothetical protein [Planctomycetaceae bacterium]
MTYPKTSRKRWRIALFVAVLFAAVAWLVAFPAFQRHRAIQEIEGLGGYVLRESTGPQWLSRWGIGFDRVYVVGLDGNKITDDGLNNLSHLPSLRMLGLAETDVNDDQLMCVRRLTNLQELDLQKKLKSVTRD